MIVKLMNSPDESIVAEAARMCYKSNSSDEQIINTILGSGHTSPLEHISFTFKIEGVSRALLAQLTRHRIASFTVVSQRYVDQSEFHYKVPNSIIDNAKFACSYNDIMREIEELYHLMVEGGIPKEDARMILPNACLTNLVMTMNARELLHFFKLRCCNRAQWEIRYMAYQMLKECYMVSPIIFEWAGAPCVHGSCTEQSPCGNMQLAIKAYEDAINDKLCTSGEN